MKRVGSGAWLGRLGKRAPTAELKSEIFPWPTAGLFLFAALGGLPPVANEILPWKTSDTFFAAALALGPSKTSFIKKISLCLTSQVSHAAGWRGACSSTIRDGRWRWL